MEQSETIWFIGILCLLLHIELATKVPWKNPKELLWPTQYLKSTTSFSNYLSRFSFQVPTDRNGLDRSPQFPIPLAFHLSTHCSAAQSLSRVWLFAAPWTVACQAPLSMEFSRQEYWFRGHFLIQGIILT